MERFHPRHPGTGAPDRGARERELFDAWQSGDNTARGKLIELHRGLAVHVAGRYAHTGESLDDLVQIAMVGLCKAVDRFDPSRDVTFATFAVPTILGELRHHFRDQVRPVRLPRRLAELARKVRQVRTRLEADLCRKPTVVEIAGVLVVPVEDVLEALQAEAATSVEPLDTSGADASGHDDALSLVEDRELAEALIGALPPLEQDIVRRRFYDEKTQDEIAAEFCMSQMQVSRLLRRSLAVMRALAVEAQQVEAGSAEVA